MIKLSIQCAGIVLHPNPTVIIYSTLLLQFKPMHLYIYYSEIIFVHGSILAVVLCARLVAQRAEVVMIWYLFLILSDNVERTLDPTT